jgi:hypothetical protein
VFSDWLVLLGKFEYVQRIGFDPLRVPAVPLITGQAGVVVSDAAAFSAANFGNTTGSV